jgi:hypothetical protein
LSPWSPATRTTVRPGPPGGIPKRSLTPWTTSAGTATLSSSGSRLGEGLVADARWGGVSGKARHITPIDPVAAAVRQATRAPMERPPVTTAMPASCAAPNRATTAVHASSR